VEIASGAARGRGAHRVRMVTGTNASWRPVIAGAGEGAVATVAMSGVMLGARRAGWLGEPPPRKITRRALRRATGSIRSLRGQDPASTVAHLAFGAAAGSLFEAVYARSGRSGAGPLAGAAFGAAIWLVSYAGWVPALGLMPPQHRDRPGRQGWMLAAHLVYGAVLGALADRRKAAEAAEAEEWLASGI
jgi:Family of unknown function (DUF6789)